MRRIRTGGTKMLFGLFVILIVLSFAAVNLAQEGDSKPLTAQETQEKRIAVTDTNIFKVFPTITITKNKSGKVVFKPLSTKDYEVKLFPTYQEALIYIEKMSVERKLTPVPLVLTVKLSSATEYVVITPLAGCIIGGKYYPKCPR